MILYPQGPEKERQTELGGAFSGREVGAVGWGGLEELPWRFSANPWS